MVYSKEVYYDEPWGVLIIALTCMMNWKYRPYLMNKTRL